MADTGKQLNVYEQLFPNRFLTAGLLQEKIVTLTIKAIAVESLEGDEGVQEKAIVSFKETDKQLVLAKTNAIMIREMFGNRLSEWVGKRIHLNPTTTKLGPQTVPCIRVYGSPDLPADKQIQVKLPKKKPLTVTMRTKVEGAK